MRSVTFPADLLSNNVSKYYFSQFSSRHAIQLLRCMYFLLRVIVDMTKVPNGQSGEFIEIVALSSLNVFNDCGKNRLSRLSRVLHCKRLRCIIS